MELVNLYLNEYFYPFYVPKLGINRFNYSPLYKLTNIVLSDTMLVNLYLNILIVLLGTKVNYYNEI